MLLEYYGLSEQPFGVTPDSRAMYFGSAHREALASLVYGTASNRGFIALIAEPGMGKTSLLYRYLEGLRDKARTAFLFQTDCHPRELLRHILADLGQDASGKDLPSMHQIFNNLLTEEMRAGRRVILVIDEAQNLEVKALESIRLLSNFETPWMKLVQIVLAGQPQLAERLSQPSLVQLRQRISMVVRIAPFTRDETGEYIRHRLSVAGYTGPFLFTSEAEALIALHSQGIPRNINNICFNAMSLACALHRKKISREIVGEVLSDLDLKPLTQNIAAGAKIDAPADMRPEISHGVTRRFFSRASLAKLAATAALVVAVTSPLQPEAAMERGFCFLSSPSRQDSSSITLSPSCIAANSNSKKSAILGSFLSQEESSDVNRGTSFAERPKEPIRTQPPAVSRDIAADEAPVGDKPTDRGTPGLEEK